MPARWFRVYEDVIDDPKIIILPEALRWSWIAMLCLASKNGGTLPPIAHIALSLRLTTRRASSLVAKLCEAGLLDKEGDSYAPHNWAKRQYRSDPTAALRSQRYRARKRKAGRDATGDERDAERDGHRDLAVTASRPETDSEPESETESETDTPQGPQAGWGKSSEMDQAALRADAQAAPPPRMAHPSQDDIDAFTAQIADAFARAASTPPDLSRAAFWLREGFERSIVLATISQLLANKTDVASLNYFDAAILRAHAARAPRPGGEALAAETAAAELPIEDAVAFFARTEHWSKYAGPRPGQPGCRASAELLARHGLAPDGGRLPKSSEGREP